MTQRQSAAFSLVNGVYRRLAKSYVHTKKPRVIAVGGSVGKTSTKLFTSKLLAVEKRVSYMDDSYNSGIGLFLSIFRLKVPSNLHNIFAWLLLILRALAQFLTKGPDILVIEYGIDHPGEMDEFLAFLRPDIAVLTAVSPEHMEFLLDIDTVAREELKLVASPREFSVINSIDVAPKYIKDLAGKVYTYGGKLANSTYEVTDWTTSGAIVTFKAEDLVLKNIKVKLISEPLIRQLAGAILVAKLLGVSGNGIKKQLESLEPAASRMMLLDGINNSTIIDDTTNFSPLAGVEALKALKKIPAKRRIAILGNMHELGDYADEGFEDVASHFEKDIDALLLVGDLSIEMFSPYAQKFGFKKNENLFLFKDAVSAGVYARDHLVKEGDVVLAKGPFGGFYLEEAVKKLLRNPDDAAKLTRQSDFWIKKKARHFGDSFYN